VFVIVDNGSAHRGQRSIDRLQATRLWPPLRTDRHPVRVEVHARRPRPTPQPRRPAHGPGRLTRRIRRGHERMLEDRLAC
jgi:hypothetical protein